MHLRAGFLGLASLVGTALTVQTLSCGTRSGMLCEVPMSFERNRPNLYFVLDHSGSMSEDNKWGTVRGSLTRLVARIGARARIGAAMFPGEGQTDCTPGSEVLPLTVGSEEVPDAGASDGRAPDGGGEPTVLQRLLAATNKTPRGGTPTGATLRKLTSRITSFEGRTFVILATDGGPNCNPQASCGIERCTANIDRSRPNCAPNRTPSCCEYPYGGPADCLDEYATVDAVAELKAAGVPTFVIGIPGSAPYAEVLEKMALAGGTARPESPRYYRVDSVDEKALTDTLIDIVKQASISCTLPLEFTPYANMLRVTLDGEPVANDPRNGWSIEGSNLVLRGKSCDRLWDEATLEVSGVDECR